MNMQLQTLSVPSDSASESDLPVLHAASTGATFEGHIPDEHQPQDEQQWAVRTTTDLLTNEAPNDDPLKILQAELSDQEVRLEEVEDDLRAAEDQIHRLEAELRLRNTRIAQLQRQVQREEDHAQPNSNATDSMLATTPDMVAALAAADAAVDSAVASPAAGNGRHQRQHRTADSRDERNTERAAPPRSSPPEGAARFLVLVDGDREVVHLLGRRTTIGRGPDNDIQVDQRFVSRHHAILIAGPNQTVIEDLRSTNGILVNGQRVRRTVLNDGDAVLVGKTQFRFALRRS
jgi:FHA domain